MKFFLINRIVCTHRVPEPCFVEHPTRIEVGVGLAEVSWVEGGQLVARLCQVDSPENDGVSLSHGSQAPLGMSP